MKKYFLDCGSNIGQGYEFFHSVYGDSFDYILFEPNPNCFAILQNKYGNVKNVSLQQKAVYINHDLMELYFDDPLSEGASLVDVHNSLYYDSKEKNKIIVQCVDIVKLIEDISESGCQDIIVKLDVESSEYAILEKMIDLGTIFKIHKLYVEFHSQYMNENDHRTEYKIREKNIINFMEKNNINFEIWH